MKLGSRLAALSFVLASGLACPARAEAPKPLRTDNVAQLHLDDVYAPATPDHKVELYLRALSAGRVPVESLGPKDIKVRQDEARIDPADVEVTLLENARRGVACVLVLDDSPSMREPFEDLKRAALGFLDRVGSYDRVAVVTFSGTIDVVADFTKAKPDVRRAIDALHVSAEPAPTRVYDGVHRALELIRQGGDLPRRSLVIIFSDGSDGGSEHSLDELVELAKGGVNEPRILIFGIGYPTGFGDKGLAGLRRLAEQTTADFVRADPGLPLADFYATIWTQMMKSYLLRYPTRFDGELHRIEVSADDAKDERSVRLPDLSGPVWPWVLGGALAFAAASGALIWWLLRRTGRLVIQSGPQHGRAIRLRPGLNRIGRLPDNEVVLDVDTVSHRHAEIEVQGRKARIRDLDSSNGTFVNDAAIEADTALRSGDRVRLADVDLVYQR